MVFNIIAVITAIIVAGINTNIASIVTALPFLQSLTPEQRKKTPEMGTVRYGIITAIYTLGIANTGIFPGTFNLTQVTASWNLYNALTRIEVLLSGLLSKVRDTKRLVGNDLYKAGMQMWEYEKTAHKNGDVSIHDEVAAIALSLSPNPGNDDVLDTPAGGQANLEGVDTTVLLVNTGASIVGTREETASITTEILVNPSDSSDALFTNMIVANKSLTVAAQITFRRA